MTHSMELWEKYVVIFSDIIVIDEYDCIQPQETHNLLTVNGTF